MRVNTKTSRDKIKTNQMNFIKTKCKQRNVNRIAYCTIMCVKPTLFTNRVSTALDMALKLDRVRFLALLHNIATLLHNIAT